MTTAPPHDVAADQVAELPDLLATHIVALIDEHESAKTAAATPESRCSRDADKLDCLLQAREYQSQGNEHMQPWIDSPGRRGQHRDRQASGRGRAGGRPRRLVG